MSSDITPEQMEKFLIQVMDLEKRYAHELRNVKTERRGELMELLGKFCAKEMDRE